ncbi:MAG TPA: serine hydrolase domain-containing protein, partial [Planctomycetota bacterium]|nr:serine hydrolase domain-containing protein [Planctomycetota bacterium]
MAKVGATAATFAVSRDGALLCSRGLGFRDCGRIAPTPPDALFRIASITKPLTAAAVRSAAARGLLDLDAKAFALIGVTGPRGRAPADPRVAEITVRHLLEHRAGWDRAVTFDPVFRVAEAGRELQIDRDPTPRDLIAWMLTKPLQSAPGERAAYSNFGYCVLGRVLEQATGERSYYAALQKLVLRPAQIADVKLARS